MQLFSTARTLLQYTNLYFELNYVHYTVHNESLTLALTIDDQTNHITSHNNTHSTPNSNQSQLQRLLPAVHAQIEQDAVEFRDSQRSQ